MSLFETRRQSKALHDMVAASNDLVTKKFLLSVFPKDRFNVKNLLAGIAWKLLPLDDLLQSII